MLALLSVGMLTLSAQAIETAGEVFVNLDASDASAGTGMWTNPGSVGDFVEIGDPIFANVGGLVPAVISDGLDDAYQIPIDAPAGLVGLDPTRTIEAWVFNPEIASEETVVSWGKRGGPDGSNMSFNYGNHGNFGAVGHWGGGTADMGWVDNAPDFTPGAPDALQWHHLVYTYDGTTTRVYSDGVLQNSEVLGPGVINTHANTKITVASQLEADGVTLQANLKGSMAISRLRIHDGVLTDAQILSNFNEEQASFPNPEIGPPTDPVPTQLATGPIHRYSFNNAAGDASDATLVDSVGGANGIVRGAGATFNGSRLSLPGGSSDTAAYGDLPNGMISGLTSTTIEGWISVDGSQTWQRIFDFGSNEPGGDNGEITGPGDTNGGGTAGLDYLFLSANRGDNVNQQRVELRNEDPAGGGITTIDADNETVPPQDVHFAVVFDAEAAVLEGLPEFGTTQRISYYRDGELVAQGDTATSLSEINDVNNWLGRSNWTNDANFEGSFDEFRIYDRALSAGEILGNIEAGAETVNVIPEPNTIILLLLGTALGLGRLRRRRG